MQIDRRFFLDTSALVKHYHEERGSDVVNELWQNNHTQLLISRLAVLEFTSAIAAKYRVGEITLEEFNLGRYRFLADVGEGRPQAVPLTNSHYQLAEQLLRQHGPSEPMRTLDALQLSAAMRLHEQTELDGFVAADRQLLRLAKQNDLPTLNLERVARRSSHD